MREAPALLLLAILGSIAAATLPALTPPSPPSPGARAPVATVSTGVGGATVVAVNPYESSATINVFVGGASIGVTLGGGEGLAVRVPGENAYSYTGCIMPGDVVDLARGAVHRLAVYVDDPGARERLGKCGARMLSWSEVARLLNESSGGTIHLYNDTLLVAYPPRARLPRGVNASIDYSGVAGYAVREGSVIHAPSRYCTLWRCVGYVGWRSVEPGTIVGFYTGAWSLGGFYGPVRYAEVNLTERGPVSLAGGVSIVELDGTLVTVNLSYTALLGCGYRATLSYRGLLYNPPSARKAYLVAAGPLWLHVVYLNDDSILVHPIPVTSQDVHSEGPSIEACDPYYMMACHECHIWWSSLWPAACYSWGCFAPWNLGVAVEAILLRVHHLAYNATPAAILAPPASVVCWWIDYDHDGMRDTGEVACTWTRSGRVALNLPSIDAYNATVWVASTASAASSLAVLPGGGLEATSVGVEGLVLNATLPGGSLRVQAGTVVYAEASCGTSLELIDSAGHRVVVWPEGDTVRVTAGSRSVTLPCTTGYRVYWAPDGLVTIETGAATTAMQYTAPAGAVRLEARGDAWMGLLPSG